MIFKKLSIVFFYSLMFLFISVFAFANYAKKQSVFFIENKGQVINQYSKYRTDVKFFCLKNNVVVFFKTNGISYQFNKYTDAQIHTYRVDLEFVGKKNNAWLTGNKKLLTRLNYYDNSGDKFITANTYEEIFYSNLYDSINLRFYNHKSNLKYDFIVLPYADYKKIKIKVKGARKIRINEKGDLMIVTPFGTIVENPPLVIQNNKRLKSNWILQNDTLSFRIEKVDPGHKLIIDPLVRIWSTYMGGSGQDVIYYSNVDNAGNLYVSGYTNSSSNIATVGSHQNVFGGQGTQIWGDAFVAKYNSSGALIWSTYYGGTGSDFGSMINVDAAGNVYLVGATLSTNTLAIATPLAHQTAFGGGSNTGDAFIVKFNANGLRIWGTYFGGSGDDYADGAALDNAGNLYLTGVTSSTESSIMTTPGCFQQTYGGGANDAFLAKFDSNGNRIWSTYIGGSGIDNGLSCNLDISGNILIAGYTTSTNNISTSGSHQSSFSGGLTFGDGFFSVFDPNGNRLYGTYYGGPGEDYIGSIVTHSNGDIFIAGSTSTNTGTNIATPGSYQPGYSGGLYDFFLAKFNSSLVRQWGTYYGGAGNDEMGYCSINNNGVYLCGRTTGGSQSALTTSCSYQATYGGGFTDMALANFDFNGSRIWATLYGGNGTEDTPAISCDVLGNIYLTGATNSSNGSIMTTSGAQQTTYGGGASDGLISKFDGCKKIPPPNSTPIQNMQVCFNNTTVLSTTVNCGIYWYNSPVGGTPLFSGSSFTTGNITLNTTYYIEETTCGTSTRTAVDLTVIPLPIISSSISPSSICLGQSATISLSGAISYSMNNVSLSSNTILVTPTITTTYTITGSNANNCTNSSLITVTVNPCTSIDNQLPYNPFIKILQSENFIEIFIPSSTYSIYRAKILNINGQVIYESSFDGNSIKFSLENIPVGIYILRIDDIFNKRLYYDKFVKF